MTPSPCPFCGSKLLKTTQGWQHPTLKQGSERCPLVDHHFGDGYLDWVGWQREKTIHYAVIDGFPVFNGEGKGTPVGVDELNVFFAYVKEKNYGSS